MDFGSRQLARAFLGEFARTRAPLMGETRWAVLRAIALAVTASLLRRAADPELCHQAARTLGIHTRGLKPSRRAATRRQFALASALLTDVIRLGCERVPPSLRQEALAELLAGDDGSEGLDRRLKWMPVAVLLDCMMNAPSARVRLRACRWILSRTRPLARRVGYGKQVSPEESEAPKAVDASSPGLLRAGVDGLDSRVPDEHVRADAHGRIDPCAARAPP